MNTEKDNSIIISYYTLRKLIGILGMALPVTVILGGFIENGFSFRPSISGYYFTNMRDYLVGLLIYVGLFLIAYKGYEKIDNILSNICGICAIGVAVFPSSPEIGKAVKVGIFLINDNISSKIHFTFAAVFFILLAFISIFLFTKHGDQDLTPEKIWRNRVYKICGIIMFSCMVLIELYVVFFANTFLQYIKPVLLAETIALFAFGISWLVKGNTIFKDKEISYDQSNHGVGSKIQ